MSNEVVDLITKVENHITEAAPHVWEATLAKIQVEAISSISVWLLMPTISLVLLIIASRRSGGLTTERGEVLTNKGVLVVASAVLAVVALLTLLFGAVGSISQLMVPEYHAMHDIRSMFK